MYFLDFWWYISCFWTEKMMRSHKKLIRNWDRIRWSSLQLCTFCVGCFFFASLNYCLRNRERRWRWQAQPSDSEREWVGDAVWPAAEPTLMTPDHLNLILWEQIRHTLSSPTQVVVIEIEDKRNWMDIDAQNTYTHTLDPFFLNWPYQNPSSRRAQVLWTLLLVFFYFTAPYFGK